MGYSLLSWFHLLIGRERKRLERTYDKSFQQSPSLLFRFQSWGAGDWKPVHFLWARMKDVRCTFSFSLPDGREFTPMSDGEEGTSSGTRA